MRIAVLLSGGVDSSVALRLLHAAGHELTAFYLKVWLEDELAHLGACPWEDDLRYARAVCEAVDVPLEVVPLQREYHERVVAWTVAELRAGRTPSPDVLCNRSVKFGAFVERLGAARAGFDKVASGHYARVDHDGSRWRLLRGVDPVKDQTYFLFQLDQEQLARAVFPLGGLTKAQVRALARELGLPNHDRRDSQGICFLGKLPYEEFVRGYLGERPGEIREIETGRVLGEHRGVWFHTVGQRKGLGLHGGPWYVVAKDLEHDVVLVSHRVDLARHRRGRFRVAGMHWIGEPPAKDSLEVRVRHSPNTYACRLEALADGGLEVTLDAEDPGIAAGQWAVFYDGEQCLGGGMIVTDPHPPNPPLPEGEGGSDLGI
jgi:tRNA-specific 2-thiouridylase